MPLKISKTPSDRPWRALRPLTITLLIVIGLFTLAFAAVLTISALSGNGDDDQNGGETSADQLAADCSEFQDGLSLFTTLNASNFEQVRDQLQASNWVVEDEKIRGYLDQMPADIDYAVSIDPPTADEVATGEPVFDSWIATYESHYRMTCD